MNDDEIWDEFRWEEFMQMQDKKAKQCMELLYRNCNDPLRNGFIAREMGWTWLTEDEYSDGGFPSFFSTGIDDESGEVWKTFSEFQNESSLTEGFRFLPVFQCSNEFAVLAICSMNNLPEAVREDSTVVDFLSGALNSAFMIAEGFRIGFDHDELGGNIACCKRGLLSANLTIAALLEMKEKQILSEGLYVHLVTEATENRNSIALHIVDLREQFRHGL